VCVYAPFASYVMTTNTDLIVIFWGGLFSTTAVNPISLKDG
jgi:hypothetical protein